MKILLLSCCLTIALFNATAMAGLDQRQPIKGMIDELVTQHGFDRQQLQQLFAQVELKPGVVERITRPAEALPWYKYRNIFVKEKRIRQGVEFWNQHAGILARARREFGVPEEIIVAILGVETRYGRHRGGFRVMDSLTTLALDYPKRSKFFTRELKQFLLLARQENFNPLAIMGSYAGAMGKPQFIASSYHHYAIDFDGDGIRDLLDNTADAIGSVANYLKRHNWRPGQPIATRAFVNADKHHDWVKQGIKPKVSLAKARDYGVRWEGDLSLKHKAALIELEQPDGPEYWLGLNNFYVITRYNHSQLYAMAVYQLAEHIRHLRTSQTASWQGAP